MEVLRRGPRYEKECDRCHSLLGIEAKDLKVNDMTGGISFTCPVCGCTNRVYRNDLPIGICKAMDDLDQD